MVVTDSFSMLLFEVDYYRILYAVYLPNNKYKHQEEASQNNLKPQTFIIHQVLITVLASSSTA